MIDRSLKNYWFGYLYAAFWSYVTYSCLTHFLAIIMPSTASVPSYAQAASYKVTSAVLWPAGMIFFGWTTYRLIAQKVGMATIYALVVIHGLNILMRGIIPTELVFYIVLSVVTVKNFKKLLVPLPNPTP